MIDHEALANVLAKIAQTLVTEYGIADVLFDLCDDLVRLLGVDGAGVMLTEPEGNLRYAAASDESAALIEGLQIDLDEGPCLQAFRANAAVAVGDLTTSDVFPAFSEHAQKVGIQAVAGYPMSVHGQLIGALGLYRAEAGNFPGEVNDAAQTLAASATAYILNARALDSAVKLADQLQHALESRVVIEQAKGKLSEQVGVDVSAAFEIMRRYARSHGAKLAGVAKDVVDGELMLGLKTPDNRAEAEADPGVQAAKSST